MKANFPDSLQHMQKEPVSKETGIFCMSSMWSEMGKGCEGRASPSVWLLPPPHPQHSAPCRQQPCSTRCLVPSGEAEGQFSSLHRLRIAGSAAFPKRGMKTNVWNVPVHARLGYTFAALLRANCPNPGGSTSPGGSTAEAVSKKHARP